MTQPPSFCQSCGAALPPGSPFCQSCGAGQWVPTEGGAPTPPLAWFSNWRLSVGTALALVFAVAVTIAWFVLGGGGGGTPPSGAPPSPVPSPTSGNEGRTNGCPAPASGTWLRVAGSSSEVFNTSVVQAADCGYFTAGYVRGGKTDLILGKLDPTGGPTWTKQYTSDRSREAILGPSGFESISHERLQGGLIYWVDTVAQKDGGVALVSDSLLMVVDKDGAPVWSRQYVPGSSGRHDVAFSSLVKVDDGFVLQGVHSTTIPNTDVVLIRVDAEGKLVWATEFPDLRSDINAPLLLTGDGHLLVGGYVTGAKSTQKAAVMKLNLDGSVDWTRTVQMEDWREGDETARSFGFQTMALASNGDIILVQGYPASPGFGNETHGALISRLGADGSHKWSKQFHYFRAGGETTINQVQSDGADLLIAGSSTGFQYPSGGNWLNYNAFLARLNENGDPIWVRTLGKTNYTGSQFDYSSDYASSFVVTSDHRLLLTGYTNSFSTPQPFYQVQAPSHFDALFALTDDKGLITGLGDLMNTPDLGDDTEVWSKGVNAGGESAELVSNAFAISVEDVTYTASDAQLQARTLPFGDGGPLELTYKPAEKELVSNASMFEDVARDIDGDGIKQEWENKAAELLNPIFELDEKEDWLLNREPNHPVIRLTPWHHVANFVRVTPWPSREDPRYIFLIYAVTWSADYGGLNTHTTFLTAKNHRGDVEKVVIAAKVIGERRAKVEWVTTSAHGDVNTHSGAWSVGDRACNEAKISDLSSKPAGTELMCGELQFNAKGQLLLQASEDKHAIYPTKAICESVRLVDVPAEDVKEFGEDCGWNPSPNPLSSDHWTESDFNNEGTRYRGQGRWQFDSYNAGEPGFPLIDDLSNPALWRGLTEGQVNSLSGVFPGETVWRGWTANNDEHSGFCGGLGENDLLDWLNNPEDCVGHGVGASLEPTQELVDKLNTAYIVTITTSKKQSPAAEPFPQIAVPGAPARAGLVGTFKPGDVDVIHFGPKDVGPVTNLQLFNNNRSNQVGWLVTKVTVERKMTGEKYAWSSADGVELHGDGGYFTLTAQ